MFEIGHESPQDAAEIEDLLDRVFGPQRRHTKTVYRLRQGRAPERELCFVAREADQLRACLRFWRVAIDGRVPALLLGPIAVEPAQRGRGLGVALMEHGLAAARAAGHRIVVLVGDEDYYGRFGFSRARAADLDLPGPVDAARLLAAELVPGALIGVVGMIDRGEGIVGARGTAAYAESMAGTGSAAAR